MNKNTIIYSVVVLVVIGALVFITFNGREESSLTGDDASQDTNMQNQSTGIESTIISEGTGQEAKTGDSVSMNYTGMLENGMIFDSNTDPKFGHMEPFIFTLGAGQVIRGWDEGIVGMKVGEKRKLTLAPEYGYGESGIGGIIPANATLIFEVELVAIEQ